LVKKSNLQQFYLRDINWIISDEADLGIDKNSILALEKLLDASPMTVGENTTYS
jgi:hypothetical protein